MIKKNKTTTMCMMVHGTYSIKHMWGQIDVGFDWVIKYCFTTYRQYSSHVMANLGFDKLKFTKIYLFSNLGVTFKIVSLEYELSLQNKNGSLMICSSFNSKKGFICYYYDILNESREFTNSPYVHYASNWCSEGSTIESKLILLFSLIKTVPWQFHSFHGFMLTLGRI